MSPKARPGSMNGNWKGQNASYTALHIWLSYNYEKGNICEDCRTTTAKRLEWANISGKYRRDRNDFKILCSSCHKKFDRKNKCMKGHELTKENIHYIGSKGLRRCLVCWTAWKTRTAAGRRVKHRLWQREYRKSPAGQRAVERYRAKRRLYTKKYYQANKVALKAKRKEYYYSAKAQGEKPFMP